MADISQPDNSIARPPRIGALDLARAIALIAMASYHFTWDLELFRYLEPGTATEGAWKIYARAIATSFLFLVGFSLVLAHDRGIRWASFFKRLLMIAVAAGAITAATAYAFPDGLIFFGILHNIAAASLIGLLFVRVPPVLTVLLAMATIAAPFYLRNEVFDTPWLWWLGLSIQLPRSNDYVPLLPWLGPSLLGIAAGRFILDRNLTERLARLPSKPWILAQAGRHSLAFYLIHQPVLIGIVYVVSLVAPAPAPDPAVAYGKNCNTTCTAQQSDAGLCERFCNCTLDKLVQQNLFAELQSGAIKADEDTRILGIANQCSIESQTR